METDKDMKRLLSIIVMAILCFAVKAQTPYYYYNHWGEKEYLTLNTEFAFLSVKDSVLPDDILQRNIRADELKPDWLALPVEMRRYYTKLTFEEKMPDGQYLNLLADMKRKNREVIISSYFNLSYQGVVIEVAGLSNFFTVELKDEKDTTLLRQMLIKTNTVIIQQNPYRPLFFNLSTTEASELNAMECANLFHESGLFQDAGPDLFSTNFGIDPDGTENGPTSVDVRPSTGDVNSSIFHPNPVNDMLTVNLDRVASNPNRTVEIYTVCLYDGQGSLQRQVKAKGGKMDINVSNLPNGIYFLHIDDGISTTSDAHKVIVKH